MLHNNYTQQDYSPCHVILPADPSHGRGALLLGDLNAATDHQLLAEHGVRTIITAAAGLDHLEIPAEQTHVVFPLLDLKNENIEAYFDLSFQTIDENLKRGAVLVHCGAGISRSATLVIAYYMKKYDSLFAHALKHVRKIRPAVCPNLGFELQLKKYQERLAEDHFPQRQNMSKQISQHEQGGGRAQLEGAKQMNLTFNAPTKETNAARMAATNARNFTAHTPILSRKHQHLSGQKRKIEEGGLFIEGRQAVEPKSESLYDPEKYWPKGGLRRKEIHSFKT